MNTLERASAFPMRAFLQKLSGTYANKGPFRYTSSINVLPTSSCYRIQCFATNAKRLTKGERRRRRHYLQRKAVERERKKEVMTPQMRSAHRKRQLSEFNDFVNDEKLVEFDKNVRRLVQAISFGRQPITKNSDQFSPDVIDIQSQGIEDGSQVPFAFGENSRFMGQGIQDINAESKTSFAEEYGHFRDYLTVLKDRKDSHLSRVERRMDNKWLKQKLLSLSTICRKPDEAMNITYIAESLVKDGIWESLSDDITTALIYLNSKAGLPENALQIMEDHLVSKNSKPTARIVSYILDGYIRKGNKKALKEGWRTYNMILSKYNVSYSLELYERLIKLSALEGEIERALSFLDEAISAMSSHNIENDLTDPIEYALLKQKLYHNALQACSRSIYLAHISEQIYQQMESDISIPQNNATFSLLLTNCARTADIRKAEIVWSHMVHKKNMIPDIGCYNTMLNVYARSQWNSTRRKKSAFRILNPEKIQIPDEPVNEVEALIDNLRYGDFDKVVEETETVLNDSGYDEDDVIEFEKTDVEEYYTSSTTPDEESLEETIQIASDDNDKFAGGDGQLSDHLDRVLTSRHNPGIRTLVANRIQPAHTIQQSNIGNSEALFASMVNQKLKPDIITLNTLCKVYASALRINRAEEVIFDRTKQFELKPDKFSYDILVRMYVRTKRIKKARNLVYLAWQVGGYDSLLPRTIAVLMDGLARHGHLDEALLLLKRLRASTIDTPDERFLRILRLQAARLGEEAKELIGPDPNAWRSKPTVKKALLAGKNSKRNRKKMAFLQSMRQRY